jgi:hypothetical protein
MDRYKRRKGHTHYPVPGSFSVSKGARKKLRESGVYMVLRLYASTQWTHRWQLMRNHGYESRIKFPVSTRLYIPTKLHQGMCVEIVGVFRRQARGHAA